MSYRIIIDSCGELTKEMKADGHFVNAPLTLNVDGEEFIDDETFDQARFLKAVADSPNVAKSACPSPESYLQLIRETDAEHIYMVTLSEQLSGSYNSACLAKEMYEEEVADGEAERKDIVVYNSRSASIGETIIGVYIQELEESGRDFETIARMAEVYAQRITTLFVLENLETMQKNGRMSKMKAFAATALNIKPVLGNTEDGNICLLDQARGMNKSLDKMVQKIAGNLESGECSIIAIAHCNNRERAMEVKERLEKAAHFHRIIVVNTAGCSSMYANQGGIIVAYPGPIPEASAEDVIGGRVLEMKECAENAAEQLAQMREKAEAAADALKEKAEAAAEELKERLRKEKDEE